MNQIANTLISVLGLSRQDQIANDRDSIATSSVRQLSADELKDISGGDDTGPRGGWIAATASA